LKVIVVLGFVCYFEKYYIFKGKTKKVTKLVHRIDSWRVSSNKRNKRCETYGESEVRSEREREGGSEFLCNSIWCNKYCERKRMCVCVCECVKERERERERNFFCLSPSLEKMNFNQLAIEL